MKFVSLNVNGLGDQLKCREIFKYLKIVDASLILLQETHSTKETEHLWWAEWGCASVAFNHGTSASRGVALFVNRGSPIEIVDTHNDNEGRWQLIDLKIEDTLFTIANMYGPNEDKAEFFIRLFSVIEETEI